MCPVSYTHLLMFSISGCSDTPPAEDTVSETVIDVPDVSEEEHENEEEIINICIDLYDKAAAVSYTHLDVYKRQICNLRYGQQFICFKI